MIRGYSYNPPELRPLVPLDGKFTTDLNDLTEEL